ncbi:hypothetical protein K431DRAFT_222609 [Polychaeton citri CBS 116435]|uniref:Rab proteins geranylgeranyltransferase n=1 Tax=Polychaeton citri CBS 116435 TaxID=1314669 RepID=A0A9P4UQX5_9PEZI|nr:hypothetical protein K431DRAFT_222609 [Polychaeton citri CBS 116435]
MESLDNTEWDVVIAGTGLPQSLLALSLSRSGKKVLHVDQNENYGGNEAALSLQEAEEWARHHAGASSNATFSEALVQNYTSGQEDAQGKRLGAPRAYNLALAPQVLYAQSSLIPALVSSHIDQQIEFQAVGSFYILQPSTPTFALTRLVRVPSSREDIFSDNGFDLKAKRALMKFLRFIQSHAPSASQGNELTEVEKIMPFTDFLRQRFGLPASSSGPLLALTLSPQPVKEVLTEPALRRLERHMKSMGIFGAGFGAVISKWGGMAEIAQVACRACAVGGGVYCLGNGVSSLSSTRGEHASRQHEVKLTGGEILKASWVAGTSEGLPGIQCDNVASSPAAAFYRSISIVDSPISSLFRPTSEGGVTPAGTIAVIPGKSNTDPPVHLSLHSSDSGECPGGQCVIYGSVLTSSDGGNVRERLEQAVADLLHNVEDQPSPSVLWRMTWKQIALSTDSTSSGSKSLSGSDDNSVLILPDLGLDLSVEDRVLSAIKQAWQRITDSNGEDFLKFESRQATGNEDDE